MMGLWTFLLCFVTILRLSTLISRVFFNLRLYDSCQSVHLPTHQGSLLIDITSHFENFQPGQMKQPTRSQLVSFSKETNDMTMSL